MRNCQKFLALESNKRPRSNKSSLQSEPALEEEELGDDSQKSQTPDSSEPPPKKGPRGKKQAKEKAKNGEAGPYKEILKELLVVKEKDHKLKEERWRETKMIHERKLSFEERKLMRE